MKKWSGKKKSSVEEFNVKEKVNIEFVKDF